MIRVKRVYEPARPGDGSRFLVDRLWPRGMKKEAMRLDGWLKEVAPSHSLRRWFAHDPARWEQFRRRYQGELNSRPEAWRPIVEAGRRSRVTLVYGARDPKHNNAMALKSYLAAKVRKKL